MLSGWEGWNTLSLFPVNHGHISQSGESVSSSIMKRGSTFLHVRSIMLPKDATGLVSHVLEEAWALFETKPQSRTSVLPTQVQGTNPCRGTILHTVGNLDQLTTRVYWGGNWSNCRKAWNPGKPITHRAKAGMKPQRCIANVLTTKIIYFQFRSVFLRQFWGCEQLQPHTATKKNSKGTAEV